jgi:hypothetical protein
MQGSQGFQGLQGSLAVGINVNTQTIASGAGQYSQGDYAIAIGYNSGQTGQGQYAIAIGSEAGQNQQADYSIALGYRAGHTSQAQHSISINATSSALNTGSTGLFVNPIRYTASNSSNVLTYNNSTYEVTYGPHPSYSMTLLCNNFTTSSTEWLYQTITWSSVGNAYSSTTFNNWNWVSGSTLTVPTSGWYNFSIWLEYTDGNPFFNFGMDVNGKKRFSGAASAIALAGNTAAGSSCSFCGSAYFDMNDIVSFGVCSSDVNSTLGISNDNPIFVEIVKIPS